MTLFAMTRHTGVRVAEVGFALVALAGVLLAVAPVSPLGRRGTAAGGAVLAAGAVVIILAIRLGSFGSTF